MVKLESFQIGLYRSCLKTKIEPRDGLTAMIGINGSGKSNILNAILLLKKMTNRDSLFSYTRKISTKKCPVHAVFNVRGKKVKCRGSILYDTDEKNKDLVKDSILQWNLQEFTGQKEWVQIPTMFFNPDGSMRFVVHSSSKRLRYREISNKNWFNKNLKDILPEKIYPVLKDIFSFLSSTSYYSASQFSDPSRCPVVLELDSDGELRRHRYPGDHSQFIFDLYNEFSKKSKISTRFINLVGKFGLSLIDGLEFKTMNLPSSSYQLSSVGKIKKIENNKLLIIPMFKVDGKPLSPNQLSEGTFKTLALLYYIIADESNLLLIEEPEVCIHHGLLNSVLALIKQQSKGKQIIISTHSNFVLDNISPEDVVLIKKTQRSGTTASYLPDSMSRNEYRALKNYLESMGNLGEFWRESGFGNG